MTTQKQRIEELERRVRELESRPMYAPAPILVQPIHPPPYWAGPGYWEWVDPYKGTGTTLTGTTLTIT